MARATSSLACKGRGIRRLLWMDRRVQKTRLAIRDAFFTLLLDNSSGKLTVAQIARTANIDRKTFYLHYESVEDIFTEFSQEKVAEFRGFLEESGFFRQPFYSEYLLTALNHLLLEDLDFYRKLSHSVDTFNFWEQVQSILVETIVDVYKDTAKVSPLELELHAQYFASGILTIYLRWLQDDKPISAEELSTYASRIAAFGLVHLFGLDTSSFGQEAEMDS